MEHSTTARDILLKMLILCSFSAESYGLAAEAYSDALEGCKKTSKKVEETYVAKMQEANVRM